MQERLPATAHSVARARRAVQRFVAELEVDADAIVLAVSEAVANVVVHAYDEGTDGIVELSATALPFEVAIEVRDQGRGLGGSSPRGAGFGLEIIRRVAQHVELADTGAGVALTMRFRRGASGAGR
jgi:anti-sigma regulatory factor (Ser/Thr protein kinase)